MNQMHSRFSVSFAWQRAAVTLVAAAGFAAFAAERSETFDGFKPGELPPGWTSAVTGKGEPQWRVEKDGTAPSRPNVLKQSGEAAFPLCIKSEPRVKDGFVEVKFKAMSGREDQAGGVLWRVQDANNYYICRANAEEDNVVLYKVIDGKRKSLPIVGREGGYGVKQTVESRTWHTLRVDFAGSRFAVTFNGKQLFEVEDDSIQSAGQIGLWTKADSVTAFDDFRYGVRP